jgi:hypothetical protein
MTRIGRRNTAARIREEVVMKQLAIVVLMAGMVLLVLACGSGGGDPVTPTLDPTTGVGTLNISMDDFKFSPKRIDLTACQKVRVVLTNNSATNDHGFTVGYGLTKEGGSPSGFERDWFDDIEVAVTGPAKMVKAGNSILTHEEGGEVEDGAGGFMVLKAPSSQATIIEFTVPAEIGDFEFASFESDGKHYEDGMKGLIKVFPGKSARNDEVGKSWQEAKTKCL